MVKVTTSPSGLSPATAVDSPRARIYSTNSADLADAATMVAMDATADKARSIQFDDEATRGHGDCEDDEGEDEEGKAEFVDVKTTAELLGEVEELLLQVSQMGRPLPVGRNLAAELEDDVDDDDDDEQGVAPGDPDRHGTQTRRVRTAYSHMQTPKTLKCRNARYAEYYDAADEAELGGDDCDDGRDYRDSAEDSAKDTQPSTWLTESRRSERRDDRRDDWRDYRRDDRRTRRDDGRDRRVTVAATADDEEKDGMECQPSRRLSQHCYDDDESDYSREAYSDSEGGSDHDPIDTGLADGKSRGRNGREDSTRSQKNSTKTQWRSARPQGSSTVQWNSANQPTDTTSRANRFTDRLANYGRRGDSRERAQRPPGSLHAEKFKLGGPPTLTGCDEAGLPQSAEPVAEAKYIFEYVGKAGKPERVWMHGNDGIKMDGIDGELHYSKEESRARISNADAPRIGKGAMGMAMTIKLLPGERLGWWSAQKFDRRVRMRALVMGAVNDQRTKILLDTGANILAINATFARTLRLKRQASRDAQIGVQGIGKDKVGTSTRAWVKITLGWEVSYEYEVWVMDHYAGVDLILGPDFMVPAGIHLDLYNSQAKLPDEVVVPLIKSLNSADDSKGGLQITDGSTETIRLTGRVAVEFRARRRQPAETTHELWVRRTRIGSLNKHGKVARVLLTSMKLSMTWCPAHFPVLSWAPHGILPPEGVVRLSSAKYRDWQAGDANGENYGQAMNLASGPEAVTRGRPEADDRSQRGENSADAESEPREMTAALRRVLETSDGLDGPVVSPTRDEDSSSRALASAVNSAEFAEGDLVSPRGIRRFDNELGEHLKKHYKLLKALLKAGLIAFSNSPWASPIVSVLKKNGVDIRLCIDYKLVKAITLMMEYAMPLVDDLLTELNAYLWFCSLDAASGFWPVMMTRRARRVSAFACALGHFEWLRMPFELKNSPMIYQRLIDNALWGYVQPKGGWEAFAERIRRVEIEAEDQRVKVSTLAEFEPTRLTKFNGDRRALAESDPMQDFIDSPAADMFNTGEPDQSNWTGFSSASLSAGSACIFAQPKVDFLSHMVTPEGIQADQKKMAAIAELPFPTSKKGMQAFLGALIITDDSFRIWPCPVAPNVNHTSYRTRRDTQAPRTAIEELGDGKNGPRVTLCTSPYRIRRVRLVIRRLGEDKKNGGHGSCLWILWRLPSWDIEIAATAHFPSTTVNIAEYPGMNNGVVAALQRGVSNLIIVGDSRLAIQQSMGGDRMQEGRVATRVGQTQRAYQEIELRALPARRDEQPVGAFENPSKPPTRRVAVRNEAEFGGAQSQVPNDIAELHTELSEARTPVASDIDPLVVQAERRQRISKAHDEELRWADLKAYLKGESTQLSHRRVHNAGKVADEFVLSEDGLLYRQNNVRRPEELGELGLTLRLVAPTTMIDEVLQNCHNSIEGGTKGLCGLITESKQTTTGSDCTRMGSNTSSNVKTAAPAGTPPNEGGKPIDKEKWSYTSQPSSSVRRRQDGQKNTQKVSAESGKEQYREALSRQSSQPSPEGPSTESEAPEEPSAGSPAESTRSLFKEGDQVWLFMERVKPGLAKKLAHRWHGPFRAVKELGERPTTRLRPELGEAERFDFDEQRLPEHSCEPDEDEDKYEVEAILAGSVRSTSSSTAASTMLGSTPGGAKGRKSTLRARKHAL
ncbi:unnamed protein product [Phytophthora fragariaefolia]|uniref:Unnamed protein product n=1 Tax=Phytophthora fragariaefolia TaxID=1490495 RepID=A0A9W6WZ05_9STRA|nr:unnamed protein product [Phytophthora fragariaefolia]